jgi:hypothetical protein
MIRERKRRLGARAEFGNDLVMHPAEPRRMAHPRDRGDMVSLARQSLPRLPALLFSPALEMPGLAREIIKDYV